MLTRRGATLVELLIALVLAGLVLGTAARSLLVQQRAARGTAASASSAAQSRVALELLESQLSLAVAAAGDLAAPLTDTALQLRTPVAIGVACVASVGGGLLSVDGGGDAPTGAVSSPPRAGDSVWWYPGADGRWVGRRLLDVSVSTDPCGRLGVAGSTLRVRFAGGDTVPFAAAIRLTRQVRYDFYRAGDGSWQLGSRDWSEATQRFAAPQPIAGPFVREGVAELRTGFRYFGADDTELGPGGAGLDPRRVARIRVTVLTGPPTGGTGDRGRRESRDMAVRSHGG